MGKFIYLDNAATTYPKPEKVYQAMDYANRNLAFNAGRGSYSAAKKAADTLDSCKRQIRKLANANEVAEVVLTASATVACNQILGGIQYSATDVIYVSPYEHNAIVRTLFMLQKRYGFRIEELPLLENELEIDIVKSKYLLAKEKPRLVCVTHVSNVTGYILPVEELAKEAKKQGSICVVDASQSLGLVNVDLNKLEIDFLIFAGHKTLYGPLGIGGFIKTSNYSLKPYLAGGTGSDSLNLDMISGKETYYETGSPNIVSIAGLLESLKEIKNTERLLERERSLALKLEKELKEIQRVEVFCPKDIMKRSGIVAFSIKGYVPDEIGNILDEEYQIAVRTGYHCAALIHKYLANNNGVVRASVGRYTTEKEIMELVQAVKELAEG